MCSSDLRMQETDKTYLRIDLGAHYEDIDALRQGVELLPLVE